MNQAVRILKAQAKSQAGFSLIELMIVVAIIGILTTIAVPNFNRFQAKARQTEAKSNLAAVYAAEKSFYAEWNQYWGDLRDIGFTPEGRIYYNVGFGGTPAAPGGFNGNGNSCFNTSVAAAGCQFTHTTATGIPAFAVSAAVPCGGTLASTTPTAAAFVATARGSISTTGVNDVWYVTETNVVCNQLSGI